MKELILDDCIINIKVNGLQFGFIPDTIFASKLSQLANEASRRAALCKMSGANDGNEASRFLSYVVDTLLGEGTVETIFGDTAPSPFDLCEIIDTISCEFHSYVKNRLDKLKGECA